MNCLLKKMARLTGLFYGTAAVSDIAKLMGGH